MAPINNSVYKAEVFSSWVTGEMGGGRPPDGIPCQRVAAGTVVPDST